ncbi:MAG: alpha/beta hydrolase [Geminicoccaceae bacterium]|nr:alpha/beta hydrolase [Geminicoccaceae bacterium]
MKIPALDPDMAAILKRMEQAELAPYTGMTPVEARRAQEARNVYWNEQPPAVESVIDVSVAGPFGARRMRIYDCAPGSKPRPALLYLHGGGWVIGSIDSHDIIARELARRSGHVIAAYDYVLAPEHPFPEPLEDCITAFRWLVDRAADTGSDPERISVAGDSAGAALSLGVALHQRDSHGQLPAGIGMIYPTTSARLDRGSQKRFGGGDFILSSTMMEWFWNHHAPDPATRSDPRIELVDANLGGLPPVYMSIAELDPLRDEGDLLLERLKETNTPIEYHLWRGVTHACLPMVRDLKAGRGFLQEIADFLKRAAGEA